MTASPTRSRLEHAIALVGAGKNADAKAALLRLVQQLPRDPSVLSVLTAALAALGELDTALYYANRAIEVSPRSAAALANRARVHILAKRRTEAIEDLSAALKLSPDDEPTRAALAEALESAERLDEVLTLLDQARDRGAHSSRLNSIRARVLRHTGRADEAMVVHRLVIEQEPASAAAAEAAATSSLYALNTTPHEIRELATRYGRLISIKTAVSRTPLTNAPDPERRLRIGFIGGDFRAHAAARFFEPLAHAYDHRKLECRCYMTLPGEDDVTARIRSSVDHFRHVNGIRRSELPQVLRDEHLDIAIDLAGHTTGHRIEAFHHRIAPVQATWYGLPCTTGLAAMDYRIGDSFTDPPGSEPQYVERLLRLDPCGFSYVPPPDATDVLPPPSQRDDSPTRGTITFGSFNNLAKLNDTTFALWSRILTAVPQSTLVMRHVAFDAPGIRADVMRRIASAGLGDDAPTRVKLYGPVNGSAALMREYHSIDIALDTFPYSGMTTTCEALTMGVPVISMAGDRAVSRHSLSILANCGLSELITNTPDDYAAAAIALANDPRRLTALRAESRERMARVVSNAPAFAVRFEAGLRSIWREWCATRSN